MGDSLDRIAILLISGELEKLQAAAMLSSVAAVTGITVDVFVSMEALVYFTKEAVAKKNFKHGELGASFLERKEITLYPELLAQAKMLGSINVYACSMVMDVKGWEKEDLVDIFDDVIGLTAFLSMAAEAQQTLTI